MTAPRMTSYGMTDCHNQILAKIFVFVGERFIQLQKKKKLPEVLLPKKNAEKSGKMCHAYLQVFLTSTYTSEQRRTTKVATYPGIVPCVRRVPHYTFLYRSDERDRPTLS